MRVRVFRVDGQEVTWSTGADGVDVVEVHPSGALVLSIGGVAPVAGYGLGYWASYEVLPDPSVEE